MSEIVTNVNENIDENIDEIESVANGVSVTNSVSSVTDNAYGADDIQVLKGLEAVRKRPGMYIGSTGESGLHHLVYEIVDNAIDEALAGYCDTIDVKILPNNVIEVSDNGRGIPTAINHAEGVSAATLVFTVLHAGGKFGGGGYKVSGGLHGVGASVVNALSEWLEFEICDGVNVHYQRFERGETLEPIKIIRQGSKKGTTVRFRADNQIFHEVKYNHSILIDRLREQAFLNGGIMITLGDYRDDNKPFFEEMKYDGGISSYVGWLNKKKGSTPMHDDVIYLKGEMDEILVEVAFQYTNDFNSEVIRSFANNIHTTDGGVHEVAFKKALTKVINDFVRLAEEQANAKKKYKPKKGEEEKPFVPLSGEAIREAINAIVSVKLHECEFEGQTKSKLGNPEVSPVVYRVVVDQLTYYFEENPETMKIITTLAVNAQAARDAAKKAMEAKRKSATDSAGLPGKLADCSESDPTRTEIYIVEGDSAGGSAKNGRDRRFQAILALWGKMLNVEKSRVDKVYNNEKLLPVVQALGTGLGEEFDITKLRYGRVIIMADADVDGSHIRTLLLTFFFRFMRPLVDNGHVYIAQPPLYKIYRGKLVRYAYNDSQRDDYIREIAGENNLKVEIQRYKGLGEMDPHQLWETTMDPSTRTMVQITLSDAARANEVFSILMGDKVEPRREFIEENARYFDNLDI